MLKTGLVIAALLLGSGAAIRAQIPAQPLTPAKFIDGITRFRRLILRDSTPINVCALADAFGGDGRVTLLAGTPPTRYQTLDECRTDARGREYPKVLLRSAKISGDTGVVNGITDRGGLKIIERYSYYVDRQGHRLMTFTNTGFVEQ
jgi:hypothetical protein